MAKALAYCTTGLIMGVKCFMMQAPGVDITELVLYHGDKAHSG